MSKFLVIHTLTGDPTETLAFLEQGAPEFAKAMEEGQLPAKCLYTWIPQSFATGDHPVCLWEADTAQEVEAALQVAGLMQFMTADIRETTETDWATMM